jgi:hypothetical protein
MEWFYAIAAAAEPRRSGGARNPDTLGEESEGEALADLGRGTGALDLEAVEQGW